VVTVQALIAAITAALTNDPTLKAYVKGHVFVLSLIHI